LLNDLWKFENGMWTFVNGSVGTNARSVFGPTPRVPDPNAYPGARRYCACWKDNNDHFWLFGGYGSAGYLGDTWRFDGTHWAFWGGPTDGNVASVYETPKTFSFDNHPGGRDLSGATVTSSGSAAYIVGGRIFNGKNSADIWKFESDKGWAYWAGTIGDQNPITGTIKVSSATNKLGSIYGAMPVGLPTSGFNSM
jgi:hypothetical protein